MVPSRRNNQNWLPGFFNDFFDNDWMERSNATAPAINVLENEKSYDLELAAPGMTREDFNVTLHENGDLVINMEKKQGTKKRMVRRSTHIICVVSSLIVNSSRPCCFLTMLTGKRSAHRLSTVSSK